MANNDIGFGAVIGLQDRFSGPAGRIISAAQELQSKMGEAGKRVTGSLKLMAGGFALIGGAALGARIFKPIVNATAEFETSMNRVAALTRETVGPAFDALSRSAKDMGATTRFSASQAADAQGELALAGFNAREIIATLPAVLDAAAFGQIGLAEAASITATVLRGYGIDAENSRKVSDVLARAATTANQTISDLGQAFTFAGPVAKSAGIEFEETAAALSLMADAGFRGSLGGTALRGAITRMLAPTQEAQEIMDKWNLTVRDSNNNMLPLVDIVRQLEKAGLDTGDAMTVFGQRAGPGMVALVARGAEALQDMTADLRAAEGAAAAGAAVMQRGYAGALIEMESALEGVQIEFGQASGIMKFFENVIWASVKALRTMRGLILEYPLVVAAFGSLLKASLILMTIAGSAFFAVGAFRLLGVAGPFAIKKLSLAFLSLVPMLFPLVAIGTAFAVVVATFRNGSGGIIDSIRTIFRNVRLIAGGISELFSNISGDTTTMSKTTADALEKAGLLDVTIKLFGLFDRGREMMRGFAQGVSDGFNEIGGAIRMMLPEGGFLEQMFDRLVGLLEKLTFGSTIAEAKQFGSSIGNLATKVFVAGVAFVTVAKSMEIAFVAIRAMIVGFKALAFVVGLFTGALTLPITLTLGLAAAVAAATFLIIKNWDKMVEAMQLKGFLQSILADIVGMIITVGQFIQKIPGIGKKLVPDMDLSRLEAQRKQLLAQIPGPVADSTATNGGGTTTQAGTQTTAFPAIPGLTKALAAASGVIDLTDVLQVSVEMDGETLVRKTDQVRRRIGQRGSD